MKDQTITTVVNILSTRLKNMIDRIGTAVQPVKIGLLTEIEETTAALTDIARHQDDSNAAEINAGLAAVGILIDHEQELTELERFFETGSGKGSRAHKMVKGLLKIAVDSRVETLNQPA